MVSPDGARPTINDVARAAGVSIATVSKAVNRRYGVARSTVEKVLRAAEELGYESSLIASSMRSRRTGVIGVLLTDFEPFSAEILKGVATGLRKEQYELLAYCGTRLGEGDGWEQRSLNRLSGTLIDGVIMVTPTVVNVRTDVPIVTIDPHMGPGDLPTVESDGFGGARDAVSYLVELGHTRIGYIAGRPDLRSSLAREAGYRHALTAAGLRFDPSLIGVGRYMMNPAHDAARILLARPDRPTAIFAANDVSALAILVAARELGLRVPDDLSVIGFDDIPEASQANPPVTTVRQHIQTLGNQAAVMLVALMNGKQVTGTHLRLSTRLVPRATTAPPA
ncbi:LacI family DNA-binding transcriptional regulator [Humibacter soli]